MPTLDRRLEAQFVCPVVANDRQSRFSLDLIGEILVLKETIWAYQMRRGGESVVFETPDLHGSFSTPDSTVSSGSFQFLVRWRRDFSTFFNPPADNPNGIAPALFLNFALGEDILPGNGTLEAEASAGGFRIKTEDGNELIVTSVEEVEGSGRRRNLLLSARALGYGESNRPYGDWGRFSSGFYRFGGIRSEDPDFAWDPADYADQLAALGIVPVAP